MTKLPFYRTRSAWTGFTLVELMIVIAIAAVLIMVAVPSFRGVMNTMRQNSAESLVLNDLNLARAEAIKRNASMLMCARNTGGTQCSDTSDWAVGWLVCVEGATAGECDTSATTSLLVVRPALHAAVSMSVSGAPTGKPTLFRYTANSARTADSASSIMLSGTGPGFSTRYVCVLGPGSILKRSSACS